MRLVCFCLTALLAACETVPPAQEPPAGDDEEIVMNCVTGDRSFDRASQLRALEGCREVTGNLVLSAAVDVRDLSSLASLESVSGDLRLVSTGVRDLDGLRALRRIGGSLKLESNPWLVRVDGLSALESIGKDVEFHKNDRLETVEGWSALTSVGGNFSIEVSSGLKRLASFPRLQRVGIMRLGFAEKLETIEDMPELVEMGAFSVEGTRLLTRIMGFSKVRSLDYIDIRKNQGLLEVDAFENVTRLRGFVLLDNTGLESVRGLGTLRQIDNSMLVVGNPKVSQWSALGSLLSVKHTLSLYDLPLLSRFEGMRHVDEVERLVLERLGLRDLEEFSYLTHASELVIRDNKELISLNGLRALRSLQLEYVVSYNPKLPTCEAENLLRRMREGGYRYLGTIIGNTGTGTCP